MYAHTVIHDHITDGWTDGFGRMVGWTEEYNYTVLYCNIVNVSPAAVHFYLTKADDDNSSHKTSVDTEVLPLDDDDARLLCSLTQGSN